MRRAGVAALVVALVAAGALWWVWLVAELASPVTAGGHHDFFAFYAAGTLVRTGHASQLYDAAALTHLQRQLLAQPVGYAGYMPYLNPPAAAALLSPLSALPFAGARAVWFGVTLAVAIGCALLIARSQPWWVRGLAVVLVLASFPAYQTFVEGQWSFVILLGCLGALATGRRGHQWRAGALLVVLWLKPPLLVLVLLWLLVTRRWRVAAAAVAAVLAVTVIALPWTGAGANGAYLSYLVNVSVAHASGGGAAGPAAWEGGVPTMEGLIGLSATLLGQRNAVAVDVLTVGLSLLVVAVVAAAMRGRWATRSLPLRLAVATVAAGLLLDPHLYWQDVVLALFPVALVARDASPRAAAAALLGGTLLMDLCGVDAFTGSPPEGHLFTVVLIAALLLGARGRVALPVRTRAAAAA